MHRACFAGSAHNSKLSAPGGEPTYGTFLYTKNLLTVLHHVRPTHVVFAADAPRDTLWRRTLFPEYKAWRKPQDENEDGFRETQIQFKRCEQITRALGIPIVGVECEEADDVVASIVARTVNRADEIVVAATDKDFFQLLGASNVWLMDPYTHDRMSGSQASVRKFGVRTNSMTLYQALVGDSADNLPGVKGIGSKSAEKLILRFKNWEGIVTAAREHLLPKGIALKILAAEEDGTFELMTKLVTLKTTLHVPHWSSMRFRGPDMKNVRPLFEALGFNSLL